MKVSLSGRHWSRAVSAWAHSTRPCLASATALDSSIVLSGKGTKVGGGLVTVARLGIADTLNCNHAVAADHPVVGSCHDRCGLPFRQGASQHFAVAGEPMFRLILVEIGRAYLEIQPRLFEHLLTNLAVAGQYQRHSAPVEKSVEKLP